MAAFLLPVLLGSLVIRIQWAMRVVSLLLGAAFFGQPYLTIGLDWLNRTFPEWWVALELRKYVICLVPSDYSANC